MIDKKHPILYSFRRCPYAIRARMAIKIASITCELREVLLTDKPESMLAISNKGTVPVLLLPNGIVIDESIDVMLWALQYSDPEHWLLDDQLETQELINKTDFQFKEYLDRYKYHVHYPEKPQLVYREKAEEFLCELEQRLEISNGSGLVCNRVTLVDVAIFPFVRQFARVDYNWFKQCRYSKLRYWLGSFEKSKLFLSVMEKYKPWTGMDEQILFN